VWVEPSTTVSDATATASDVAELELRRHVLTQACSRLLWRIECAGDLATQQDASDTDALFVSCGTRDKIFYFTMTKSKGLKAWFQPTAYLGVFFYAERLRATIESLKTCHAAYAKPQIADEAHAECLKSLQEQRVRIADLEARRHPDCIALFFFYYFALQIHNSRAVICHRGELKR
jgi:hypothetical protein